MATPRVHGPSPLAAFHRILMATAFAAALFVAVWELRVYGRTGAGGALVGAALALGGAGAIALYYRSLRGLGAKLTPRDGR